MVPELDPLVDTKEDASSEMCLPSDMSMALVNSNCSSSLPEGLDFKLGPEAPAGACGVRLLLGARSKE